MSVPKASHRRHMGPPKLSRATAQATARLALKFAAGTYGKIVDGFDVTDSLPMPRLTGAFAAMENMTSGALSIKDRPFQSENPNPAAVPTSYGSMLGKNRCATFSAWALGS